nr:DUF3313 domain-containing protein [Rhizobium leguminosarum]
MILGSCSSVPLTQSGTLQSYSQLGPVEGVMSKSRSFANSQVLLAATTVSISPTRLSPQAYSKLRDTKNGALVANVLDRSLCIDLSDKFRIVSPGEGADLNIQAVITDIVPTQKVAAGVSEAVTLGSSVVLPVGVPRLPIGLGGLAVEAEAVDPNGTQSAAIVWARGANSITTSPRMSEIGDAYGLASSFSDHFAQVLISGKKPEVLKLSIPSRQKLKSRLGGAPKYLACNAFGKGTGLAGAIGDVLGAPPSWTDQSETN